MVKKVLVITSSLRERGNSNALANEFAKGAKEAGNSVEVVSLAGKNIAFCRGCLACQKTLKCVINDDAIQIAEKMKNANVIAFATPIYYYSVCGQLKTMLDRANPLFASDYKFTDIYLLASAADDAKSAMDGAVSDITGWVSCFEKCSLKGVVRGVGATDIGDISQEAIAEAYKMGKLA